MRFFKLWAGVCAGIATVIGGASVAFAQTSASKLSASYIPADAIAVAFASPADLLAREDLAMLPIEVLQAAALKEVGVDPMKVASIKLVSGMPSPAGPVGGAVIEMTEPFDLENLNAQIRSEFEAVTIDGKSMYRSFNKRPEAIAYQPNPQTVLIGVGGYLSSMLDAAEGSSGQLATLTGRMSKRPGVTVVTVFGQIRSMLTPMLKQQQGMLPPQLHGLTDLFEQTDALLINVDYSLVGGKIAITLVGRDEASAQSVAQTLNQSVDFAKTMIISQMENNLQADDPVQQATLQYVKRVGEKVSEGLRPNVNGKLVQISDDGSLASIGVMTGLLLPAVQSARSAARRMNSSNNLKQIGLAFHNYHSAYRKLPYNAIKDDAGKDLLSWRVAILPFIEEQALYQQFNLKEPWDSPQNMAAAKQMPEIFKHPGMVLPPGQTIYQVPVGPGLMFEEGTERQFRDVLDGLSNTVMVVEASPDAAVPWTKPADLNIDPSMPLADVGGRGGPGVFQVLLGDGAVRTITRTIDENMFRSLLTRANGEVINEF
ncbi:DUF1559 domain-containing protein [Roseiconus lacunae]|uniref:DUF1559 domain-containing protein n=1 Tax=Roseiconus lacunae TaxID=2605694 RepID=UPI001E34DF1F|nr:DUF1559 domain-containing protein [Roseiconus lacunae]MCD0461757.1 DUF1559 domain-containing protein [Roseiconus lacunae]